MNDRRDYETAIEIIGTVIRAWDPNCLIAEGAPTDEYDGQIAKITAGARNFRHAADAAHAISAVFSASFGLDAFSVPDCKDPARRIFTQLAFAKLLPAV